MRAQEKVISMIDFQNKRNFESQKMLKEEKKRYDLLQKELVLLKHQLKKEQQLVGLGKMVAQVCHDIKSPLSVIKIASSVPNSKKGSQLLCSASERIQQIAGELLSGLKDNDLNGKSDNCDEDVVNHEGLSVNIPKELNINIEKGLNVNIEESTYFKAGPKSKFILDSNLSQNSNEDSNLSGSLDPVCVDQVNSSVLIRLKKELNTIKMFNNPSQFIPTSIFNKISKGASPLNLVNEPLCRASERARMQRERGSTGVVNLNSLLHEVTAHKGLEFKNQNVEIIFNCRGISHLSKVNERELYSVLSNLINNARESVGDKRKKSKINVSLEKIDNMVTIHIKDNGIGMDKAVLDKINKNIQVTTKTTGHGLGLMNATLFAKSSGGQLKIKSKQENGCHVSLCLPLV
ncbi:MAG: GHKL domain-containing protein [Bdellovibrionaceae bacterium]|jgi:signal transduction histidine kinase|nr:GHKL domain-containing protein [Pseudobdellovibrionaceae bacterium]